MREYITFYDGEGDEIDYATAASLGFDYEALQNYIDVIIEEYLQ